jgi:cell division protein FtsQ
MLIRRRNNRRRNNAQGWQLPALPWRKLAVGGASLAAIGAAVLGVMWMLDRPIEKIVVQGSFQRVSAADIEKAARKRVAGVGLVSIQLAAVRASLLQLPWVDEISVARQWPNGLNVQVREQTAMARWNVRQLVNARGQLFDSEPRFIPTGLPQLAGPIGSEADVVARYTATQGRMVEVGMRLVSMTVDARGAWQFALDNGVTVRLGRQQIDARFERFNSIALQLVAARAAEIAFVDMRYTNGFAVGWRGGGTQLAGNNMDEDENPDA